MGNCNCNCQQKAEKQEATRGREEDLYLFSVQHLHGYPHLSRPAPECCGKKMQGLE